MKISYGMKLASFVSAEFEREQSRRWHAHRARYTQRDYAADLGVNEKSLARYLAQKSIHDSALELLAALTSMYGRDKVIGAIGLPDKNEAGAGGEPAPAFFAAHFGALAEDAEIPGGG